MVDRKLCRKCWYWEKHGSSLGPHCRYLLDTGESRTAKMTPEQMARGECGCFEEEAQKKKRVQPMTIGRSPMSTEVRRLSTAVLSERIDARAPRFYNLGLSDRDIAKAVGCSGESIRKWRYRNHLPSNYLRGGKKRRKELNDERTERDQVQVLRSPDHLDHGCPHGEAASR